MTQQVSNNHDDWKSRDAREFTVPFWNDAMGAWGPALSGMQSWTSMCGRAATAFTSEWFQFVGRRVQEDITLPHRLASCHAFDESWRVYTEFWQRAVDDYQKEFAALSRLSGEVMTESMSNVREIASETTKRASTSSSES